MELSGQGLALAKITAEIKVSKTTLVNWERDLKDEIDSLQVIEPEAMYDKFYLSIRIKVEFLELLRRIQRELETRDLLAILTEKLFMIYAHFYRQA